ncbi:MAG: ImmA/IrrE family metallo-endopeptidase [Desulfobulbaceae bacterium]|nr:ImmA/IrrE family metallo-endopeptidase [Desulfobulbaceae bacterium]
MDPRNEAVKLLDELGLDSLPIIPRNICEKLGIFYIEKSLKEIDGILFLDHALNGMICVNSTINEIGRKNFTGAHELGHFCLDTFDSNSFFCPRSSIGTNSKSNSPIELRANEFAAELLMPRSVFLKLVEEHDPGWDNIMKLSEMSQTSKLATVIRYIELTEESCALLVCEKNKLAWFRAAKNFNLYIDMDNRDVPSDTQTFAALKGDIPDDLFDSVKANIWVAGKKLKSHSEILEWALPINSYGQVLTLLYDEDGLGDCEDEDEESLNNTDDEWPWEPPTFHKSKRKR